MIGCKLSLFALNKIKNGLRRVENVGNHILHMYMQSKYVFFSQEAAPRQAEGVGIRMSETVSLRAKRRVSGGVSGGGADFRSCPRVRRS